MDNTVIERLNSLFDKKNNDNEEYFELHENEERQMIGIHKDFRIICTCNINNIKDISTSFVNRFDVVALNNQLENLNDIQIGELIANLFISFDRILYKKVKKNELSYKFL